MNFGHSADMLAKDGEMSVNSLLTKKRADMVRELDATRPVTAGCNEPNPNNHLFRSGALDIIGFNYHDDWFAGVPRTSLFAPFIVTRKYFRPDDYRRFTTGCRVIRCSSGPNVGTSLSMMPRSLAPPTTTVMFLGATVTKVLCVM